MRPEEDGALPPHQPNCFGCGPENAAGLGLRMRVLEDRVLADLTLDHRHEGSPGVAHGGAVAAALDDLFGGVLVMLGRPAVTARLTVEYRRPVFLGTPLRLTGWCASQSGRKLGFRGTITADDVLIAEADATFLTVDISHFDKAGVPLPDEWRAWGAMQAQG